MKKDMVSWKKILCKILGHEYDYKYNFPIVSNKCECTRCGKKWKTIGNPAYNGKNLSKEDIFIWEEIK